VEVARERMNILVVTNLFHPDRGGGASVFSDMCYGLAELGHSVTVYGAYPYYPEWKNKSAANLWKTYDETIQGVYVRRFGMFLPRNPSSFLPRILFELSFMLSLSRSLFYFRRFDVVMVYCPVMGAVAYAAIRRLFYREPVWLNVQDIPADAAAASGISKGRLTKQVGQFAQSVLFNRADVWSSIAPKMIDRLSNIRSRHQPIHFVPNFLNKSMEAAIGEHSPKIGRLPSQPVRLLYAGNIGKKQGLLEFCQCLQRCDLNFHFKIHGDGGEVNAIREWVSKSSDSRFEFGPFLDERGFVGALFEADVFVITEKPGVGASFIPSKLIPCIASATPVLCVCDVDGPLGTEVSVHGLGAVIEWPDVDQLPRALSEILESQEKFTALQRNAAARALAYGRGPVIENIECELRRMMPEAPPVPIESRTSPAKTAAVD
jgi:colanic acid biosynthesis glycosyl transferase WcaI